MKRLFFCFLFLVGICLAVAQTTVRVFVNGEEVAFEGTPPLMVQGRVLVPLRGVFEKIGAKLDWDSAKQLVTATRGETVVEVKIREQFATINGEQVKLDVPAQLLNGRTMVPLRFLSEALGGSVGWNSGTSTVTIRID